MELKLDMAGVMPSLINALVILLIVAITVPAAKWALAKYPVPGLSDLVNAI